MSGEGKVTAVEKERRLKTVTELIVSGADNKDIFHYIAQKTKWELSERQIKNYIHDAREHIKELTNTEQKYRIGLALKRMSRLIQKALTKEDYSAKVVIEAQREINLLGGDYAPSKHLVAVTELSAKDHQALSTPEDFADFEVIDDSSKKLKQHKEKK